MRRIERLKKEARQSALNTEHKPGRFHTFRDEFSGRALTGWKAGAEALCINPGCNAWLRVEPNPAPNSIDISGNMFSETCPFKG